MTQFENPSEVPCFSQAKIEDRRTTLVSECLGLHDDGISFSSQETGELITPAAPRPALGYSAEHTPLGGGGMLKWWGTYPIYTYVFRF